MKKFSIIVAMALGAFSVQAQQAVVFKMRYLPNRMYKSAFNINMANTMVVPSNIKEKINTHTKSDGTTAKTAIEAVVKSGSAKADHTFPLKIEFTKFKMQAKINGRDVNRDKNPLEGQVIVSECDADGKIIKQTIEGDKISQGMKEAISGMIVQMQEHIKFPQKALKVGESFTQDTPLSLPMPGMEVGMKSKTLYKLTAIKGNLASFDATTTMTFNVQNTKKEGNGTGSALCKGRFIYNIAESHCTVMNTVSDMKYDMIMGGKRTLINSHVNYDVQTQISHL